MRTENAENVAVARAYRDGGGDFPERLAVHFLVGRFLTGYYDMVLHWADWAIGVVERWNADSDLHRPPTDDDRAISPADH